MGAAELPREADVGLHAAHQLRDKRVDDGLDALDRRVPEEARGRVGPAQPVHRRPPAAAAQHRLDDLNLALPRAEVEDRGDDRRDRAGGGGGDPPRQRLRKRAQHRVEMTATYAKELVDLARARSEEVIAPIADMVKTDRKAA